jgi:hypothetical protein
LASCRQAATIPTNATARQPGDRRDANENAQTAPAAGKHTEPSAKWRASASTRMSDGLEI